MRAPIGPIAVKPAKYDEKLPKGFFRKRPLTLKSVIENIEKVVIVKRDALTF